MDNKGQVIIFEGPDGAGKSAHAKNLHTWLNKVYGPPSPRRIWLVQDPGGTEIGREVRKYLAVDPQEVMYSPRTRLLAHMLASSAIADYYINTMKEGDILILDRFYPSTMVYQMEALKSDPKALAIMDRYVPKNALILYLYTHAEKLYERMQSRGDTDMSAQDPRSVSEVDEVLNRYHGIMRHTLAPDRPVREIVTSYTFRTVAQDVYRAVKEHCRLEPFNAAV